MTEHDLQLLSQYLDGELSPADRTALEQRLADEPGLSSALQRLRLADQRVRSLAQVPGCDRVPPHVRALLEQPQATVLPFPARRGQVGVGLAVAASLVAAVGLVLAPQWRDNSNGFHPADAASPQVAEALESAPSSADQWVPLGEQVRLRAVLSFAGIEGQWCREYRVEQAEEAWHGVACRHSSGWQSEVLVDQAGAAASGADYIPAGAGDSDDIARFIDTHATDIPLSAVEEAELIDSNWR